MTTASINRKLRVRARWQHGVFTLAQAIESGCSRSTVRRRLGSGLWEELAPRAYRVAIAAHPDWRQILMARTLSSGGVACRQSAGALYGFVDPPESPEVMVLRSARSAAHSAVLSTTCLPPGDLTTVDAIPATTPARTLIDIAGVAPRASFEDVLDLAIVQGIVRSARLAQRAQELWTPRRAGCAVVLSLLAARHPELGRARSVWEARVLRLVRDLGLPAPRCNYKVEVGGRRRYVDLAWPQAKVAVEFDGFIPHSTRRVFDDDRVRQNDLVAAGWTVFRLTKTMLELDARAALAPIALAVGSDR
ncbi:MAG: type IV toxin-antitoxin system AbiEi family antitoxin domain-containing protein [Acidimicrobiia bacterium]